MFSWYKYLIVNLVFSHPGFWSGNLFLIAPFPDLCLLVPFFVIISGCVQLSKCHGMAVSHYLPRPSLTDIHASHACIAAMFSGLDNVHFIKYFNIYNVLSDAHCTFLDKSQSGVRFDC